jgi:vanillate O-demethylase monooxygenase subunit
VLGEFRAIHAPTPETATTTHYFWGLTRDFAIHDAETTGHMVRGIAAVLEEDRVALEMQERMLALGDERPDLSAASDVAALRGRHMLERMMDAESEPLRARALPFLELANAPVHA